jgi:3-oxoacyl-[acyl-carrier protein] reductase
VSQNGTRQYEGKVVVVTGASRGIGRMLVDHFLAEGAQVAGISRGEAELEHERYAHFEVDVADAKAVQFAFAKIGKQFGTVDVVVNNAAVLTSQYSMIMPAQNAQAMVDVNLLGTFYVSREAAKLMRKRKRGRIINVGSMAASLEPIGDSLYAACKAGVSTLAGVMSKEFSSFNVTCNTLGVTAIETDMLAQLPRETIDGIIEKLPVPRYAEPDDIFNVVDFFASDRSSYVTAQTVFLGGIN